MESDVMRIAVLILWYKGNVEQEAAAAFMNEKLQYVCINNENLLSDSIHSLILVFL